jgi:hypothetical protein
LLDIGDVTVSFDENGVTDFDLLCIAAYGPFYTGDTALRDADLSERCSSDVPPPSPDAVWIGTVISTTTFRSVGPTIPCPTYVESQQAEATFFVECNGLVPGPGGECGIVRSTVAFVYDRTHATQEIAALYGSSSLCAGGECDSGTCYEDPNCACAPTFCQEEGICARARVSRNRDESYSGSGGILNLPSGTMLTFSEASAGTVAGIVSNVRFESEAFGGVRLSSPSFSGEPTPEERAAELAIEPPLLGNVPVSMFLGSGADSLPMRFLGTATETTLDAAYAGSVSVDDSISGSVSVVISLRRIR